MGPRAGRDAARRVPVHEVRAAASARDRRRDREHRIGRGSRGLSRPVALRVVEARRARPHQVGRARIRASGRAGERGLPGHGAHADGGGGHAAPRPRGAVGGAAPDRPHRYAGGDRERGPVALLRRRVVRAGPCARSRRRLRRAVTGNPPAGAGPGPGARGRVTDIPERTRTSAYLTHSDYTVPEMMRELVRQVPDRVTIESGDEHLTYAALYCRANQVAHALLDRHPDRSTPVLLLCDHGVEPPVAICGALHAGLIAAPVDVREPVERLRHLMAASGADLVVTD